MTEQPRTMEELLTSVYQTFREQRHPVILTTYSGLPESLPSNIREIFRRANREAMTVGIMTLLDQFTPGNITSMSVEKTDIWYAQNDPQFTFNSFRDIVQNVSERTR